MTITNKQSSPVHSVLQEILGDNAREFLMEFHRLHDVLKSDPHEFINGAAIENTDTGETTLYTLTIKAESNVSPERLSQYIEESIALRDKYDQENT